MFDSDSSTYTYWVACPSSRKTALIDPVRGQLKTYLRVLDELQLELEVAIDTHVHADHITALGPLREALGCTTIMGREAQAACVSRAITDGETIEIGELSLSAWYTPGHTSDSYSFVFDESSDETSNMRVFTGDTLLIRGTGRTDFQNGDPRTQYSSLQRLLELPSETLVFPAHDYKGWTVSTIGEERAHNPRLQVKDADAYAEIMDNLNLPNPKLMDVAVPANRSCGMLE